MEDHAAKVSVEEQMQITTIGTLQKDLDHGSSSLSLNAFRFRSFLLACM